MCKVQHDKKRGKNRLIFCHFAEIPKTTMEKYGIFATLLYDYGLRLWKRGEKTGRSRLIAHFSSNFWSKRGWFGRKYTNLGFIGNCRRVFDGLKQRITNSHISRRFSAPSRRFKSFRG